MTSETIYTVKQEINIVQLIKFTRKLTLFYLLNNSQSIDLPLPSLQSIPLLL